ncbi:MAG TPA: YihY/virulence factor BrkB family protein [Gaiellaceae bacterium]|nr:YihY/virulence factor BrkB family protein [Gaiellaceae bacterium]
MRDFLFPAKTEPAPTSPYRLSLRSWGSALKSTVKEFLADDCFGLAQQVAFSSLLAFFPSVILVIGLLGLLGSGAYDSLIHLLGSVAPKGVLDAIDLAKQSSADNHAGSLIALFIGVVGALWAASGATASIVKAVNRAEDIEESRPFWKVRLLALALVMLTGLVTAILFLLIIFGGPIGDAVAKRAHLGSEFTVLWNILRWPIAFAGILAFFAIVYWLAPNRSPRNWKWLTPGSILGAVLWLALSALFALYTSFSSSYDRTYGSLAGAIILLLWLNYSAVALLMGAELNAELERRASGRTRSRGTRP